MGMRSILATLNEQSTKVGVEEAGVAVVEKEYSYFLQLNDAQLEAVMKKYEANKRLGFIEAKLPCMVDDMKARIRGYHDDSGEVVNREYTVKSYDSDGPAKTKLEEDNDIGKMAFAALLSTSKNYNVRVRIYIPILDADGKPRIKKDGTELCWELDVYTTAAGSVSNWVKLEMEVDNLAVPDVKSIIPFDYETVIDSDTADEHERMIIRALYDVEYNLYKQP